MGIFDGISGVNKYLGVKPVEKKPQISTVGTTLNFIDKVKQSVEKSKENNAKILEQSFKPLSKEDSRQGKARAAGYYAPIVPSVINEAGNRANKFVSTALRPTAEPNYVRQPEIANFQEAALYTPLYKANEKVKAQVSNLLGSYKAAGNSTSTSEFFKNIIEAGFGTYFAIPVAEFNAVGANVKSVDEAVNWVMDTTDKVGFSQVRPYIDAMEPGTAKNLAEAAFMIAKTSKDIAVFHGLSKSPKLAKEGADFLRFSKETPSPRESGLALFESMTGEKTGARPKVVEYMDSLVEQMSKGKLNIKEVFESASNPPAMRIKQRNFVKWFNGFFDKLPEQIIEGEIADVLKETRKPSYDLTKTYNQAAKAFDNFIGENRVVNYKGQEPSANRPGIETPAPLPEAGPGKQVVQPGIFDETLEKDITQAGRGVDKAQSYVGRSDTLESRVRDYENTLSMFSNKDLADFGKIIRMKEGRFAGGDIETMLKDPKAKDETSRILTRYVEAMNIAGLAGKDGLTMPEIYEEIVELPTKKDLARAVDELKTFKDLAPLKDKKTPPLKEDFTLKQVIRGRETSYKTGAKEGSQVEKAKQENIREQSLEEVVRKKDLEALKQKIKERQNIKGIKKDMGKKISDLKIKQADNTGIRRAIIDYAKKHLTVSDRGKVIGMVNKKNLTDDNFYEAMDAIDAINEKNLSRTLTDQINKELRSIKPIKKGTMRVSRYDYETNKFLQQLRNINNYTQETAQAELATAKTENLSNADLIKNRLLSLKANGSKSSMALQAQVLADIQDLKEIGKDAKDEADFQKKLEKQEKKDEILKGIEGQKKSIPGLKQLKSAYISSISNLYSALNTIAGKEIADKYDYGMYQTNSKQDAFVKTEEFKSKAREIYKVKNDKKLTKLFINDLAKPDYKIVGTDGLSEDISKFDLMNIYNGVKNDLIKERYYNNFGEEQINSLLQNLTPEDARLADYLMEEAQSYKDILNQRSIETRGMDNGTVENYWPASSEYETEFFDEIRIQGETPSAMKDRTISSKVIPKMANAWLTAQKHAAEAEHVKTISRRYEELKNLFTDRTIKKTIEQKYGNDAYQTLMKHIDTFSLNYRIKGLDLVSSLYGKALNNWVKAKVSSPTVFARQMISSIYSAEEVGIKDFVKYEAEFVRNPRKAFKYMWDNVPFIRNRFKQGYSEALEDVIRGSRKVNLKMDNITKYSTLMTRGGDVAAIMINGYPIIKSEMAKHGDMEKAIEVFQRFSEKTQQSPSKANLSDPQRDAGAFHKTFFRFKNTTNQLLRLQIDANIQLVNGQISFKDYAAKTVLYSIYTPIMYVLVGYAITQGLKSIFGNDDEEDKENLPGDVIQNIIVQPFQAIPVLDAAAEATYSKIREKLGGKKYNYGMFSYPLLDDIEKAYSKLSKKEPSFADYLEAASLLQEPLTGIPTSTAMRYYGYVAGEKQKKEYPGYTKFNDKKATDEKKVDYSGYTNFKTTNASSSKPKDDKYAGYTNFND